MKSSVTKPAAAVEQCQVKSRNAFLLVPGHFPDLIIDSTIEQL